MNAGRVLSKQMLKPRKPRMTRESGAAWYYIDLRGLEVYVAVERDNAASISFRISARQLERVLRIIKEAQ